MARAVNSGREWKMTSNKNVGRQVDLGKHQVKDRGGHQGKME